MIEAEGGRSERVVLLHGLNAGPWMMWPVSRALRRDGFATTCLGYRSRDWTFDRIVETLSARIETFPETTIHLVGHSMGSLVSQALAARISEDRWGAS